MINNKKSILIVDDHADMGQTLKNIFAAKEYYVEMATSGADAVLRAEEKPYAVVLTDLVMEGLDGVDVIQRIKKIRPEALFFLMTAYPSEHRVKDAMASGVVKIFLKPFNVMELCSYIDGEISKTPAK
jgi:DNA-binding NtrC family response regulator